MFELPDDTLYYMGAAFLAALILLVVNVWETNRKRPRK